MYEVLIAIDTDEERAIAQAEAVVGLPRAVDEVRAYLLHVFEENPEGGSVHQVGAIRRAEDVLEDAGVDFEFRESSGEPTAGILEIARGDDVDLVCLSGRKRTPTGKAIFGSVTQSVILETDRPVMTVPSDD